MVTTWATTTGTTAGSTGNHTSGQTLSNGNLTITEVANTTQTATSNSSKTLSGKFMFEITISTVVTNSNIAVGIVNQSYSFTLSSGLGGDANGVGYYPVNPDNAVYYNATGLYGGVGPSDTGGTNVPNVITICVDLTSKLFWVTSTNMRSNYGSTAWNAGTSANPGTNTGGYSFSGFSATSVWICVNDVHGTPATNAVFTLNTGATAFTTTLPSGFTAWDSSGAAVGFPRLVWMD